MKTSKLLEARENANDQVAIVFNFASNLLRMAPVLWTNHSAKLDKTREMTFDTLLKIGSSRNLR